MSPSYTISYGQPVMMQLCTFPRFLLFCIFHPSSLTTASSPSKFCWTDVNFVYRLPSTPGYFEFIINSIWESRCPASWVTIQSPWASYLVLGILKYILVAECNLSDLDQGFFVDYTVLSFSLFELFNFLCSEHQKP